MLESQVQLALQVVIHAIESLRNFFIERVQLLECGLAIQVQIVLLVGRILLCFSLCSIS